MRVRVLLAVAVTLSLLASACGGGDGSNAAAPATVPATATAVAAVEPTAEPPDSTPMPTPIPVPTPLPMTFDAVFKDAPGALVRHDFAPGETVDAISGVYLLDPITGAVEGWRYPDEADRPLNVSRDNRWIVGDEGLLHDRTRGITYRAVDAAILVGPSPEGSLGVVAARGPRQPDTVWLAVVDFDVRTLVPIPIDPPPSTTSLRTALWSPDGSRLVLDTATAVFLVDVPTGEPPRMVAEASPRFGVPEVLPGGLGFVVYGESSRAWFGWDGSVLAELEIPAAFGLSPISPSGELIAHAATLANSYPGAGPGLVPGLRMLTVTRTDGQPRFRVLGANLSGRLSAHGASWLADSSALVIETNDGLWFVSRQGELLGSAPLGVPSPDNPDLFSLRLWRVTNREGTVQREVEIGEFRNAIWLGVRPWGNTSEFLRFGFAGGGRGFSSPVPLLAPVVQFPPFDEPRLRIHGADECLNLRDDPSFAGAILACAPNGTTAAVTETALPSRDNPGPTALFRHPEGETWIHIELPGGTAGWANANFLEWAP